MNARLSCLTSPRLTARVPSPLFFAPCLEGREEGESAPEGFRPLWHWAAMGWVAGLLLGTVLHFTWLAHPAAGRHGPPPDGVAPTTIRLK